MNDTLPKVLTVEDDQEIQAFYATALKGHAILLQAFTLTEAESLFSQDPDISLIVLDGCINSAHMNTVPLLKTFQKTFKGPIIAASKSPSLRSHLVEAGCTHQAPKEDVPDLALKLLATV